MKAILVVDIPDDVAEAYEDITVDYDLRGIPKDDPEANESIKYVEDVRLKPLPEKKGLYINDNGYNMMAQGWNECLKEITGETE